MTIESIMFATLVVLTLCLLLMGGATVFLINRLRAIQFEQQALRRVVANMDWSAVLANTQQHSKETVRILDIIDKRLQKLEVLEKLQISQFNVER